MKMKFGYETKEFADIGGSADGSFRPLPEYQRQCDVREESRSICVVEGARVYADIEKRIFWKQRKEVASRKWLSFTGRVDET
jgi:hypothetical protein